MQKKILLILLLAFSKGGFVVAQQFDWVRKVEIKSDWDVGNPSFVPWEMDSKIETDQTGNIFVTGHFKDTVDFGTQSLISKGEFDCFIAKYNSNGDVIWLKQIHGLKDQRVSDMDIDRNGNIYLTGYFSEGLALAETVLTGSGAFVLKLNNDGVLTLAKKIEGIQTITPTRILASVSDEFFLAGSLSGTINFGCSTLTGDQPGSKFIAHYNSAGDCQWANKFIASYLNGLTYDGYYLYMTGGFAGDGIFGNVTLTANVQDIYIARCDRNGEWGWALKIGGWAENQGTDIEIDQSGNIIATGFFAGTLNFGSTFLSSTGANDIFIASYDQYGAFNWAQQAGGGSGNQYSFDIDANPSGHLIITGSIIDETHFGNTTITPNGEKSFFAAYNNQGTCLWALGSTGNSGDRGLDVTSYHENIYVSGQFFSDGEYSFGQNTVHANQNEIYISKIKNPSQRFTRIIPEKAVGVQYSHNAWIDFDGDSDLDFLTTGANSTNDLRTILYENMGNDKFHPAQAPFNNLPQYSEAEIDFLNINNDDRIDFIFMGRRMGDQNTNRISLVENNKNGFTDIGSLPDFGNADGGGTVSVGDVNNDGLEDLFVCGYNGQMRELGAFLYYNTNGSFTKAPNSPFTGLYLSTSRFADLDNDQDLDLIVCGTRTNAPYLDTFVYLNDGAGGFSESSIFLVKLVNPSIDAFDFDGDTDLDLLLTGYDEQNQSRTVIYKNDLGSFAEIALPDGINRTVLGSATWGDYDNDGDADILITGQDALEARTLSIFINEGGQFIELIDPAFEILGIGNASWGDYDSDGDLDILASGSTYFDNEHVPTLYILRNEISTKNAKPGIPGNFKLASADQQSCTLHWDAPADDHTPSSSLTYNISMQNMNTGYLLHPFSEKNTGKRMVNGQGNVMTNKTWSLRDIEPGIYSIKVQAIDGGFEGSSWTSEEIFYAGSLVAPSNLTVTYEDGEIHLSWQDNSVNEQHFMIERKLNEGEFVKYDSVSSNVNNFADATEDLGSFTYRVYAENPNQKTNPSNLANILITDVESLPETKTHIYPNPAGNIVTIKGSERMIGDATLQIRNSMGMVVASKNVVFAQYGEIHFDVSEIPPGLYFIEMQTAESNRMMKLVKE